MASTPSDPRSSSEVYVSVIIRFLLLILRGIYLVYFLLKAKMHLSQSQSDKFTRATLISMAIAFILNFIFRTLSLTTQLIFINDSSQDWRRENFNAFHVIMRITQGLSYTLQNCSLCYNIARWYILLESLKQFGNDNSLKVERSVKILIFTTVGFSVYGVAIIYLGLNEDDQDYNLILFSI